MTSKPTLRTHSHPVQGLLSGLIGSFSDNVGGAIDSLSELLLIFQFCKFGCNNPQNDILVFGEMKQWLKSPSPRSVILQIECIDVEVLEELCGNVLVASFGKVTRSKEIACTCQYWRNLWARFNITSTDMKPEMHLVPVSRDTVVVVVDI